MQRNTFKTQWRSKVFHFWRKIWAWDKNKWHSYLYFQRHFAIFKHPCTTATLTYQLVQVWFLNTLFNLQGISNSMVLRKWCNSKSPQYLSKLSWRFLWSIWNYIKKVQYCIWHEGFNFVVLTEKTQELCEEMIMGNGCAISMRAASLATSLKLRSCLCLLDPRLQLTTQVLGLDTSYSDLDHCPVEK